MKVDYLIVGSGLTGAVIARTLHDAGRQVLVLERRSHVGGNVHDHVHASGIRVHTYGPHYFRTNSDRLWRFVNRFASFYPFEAVVKTWVDGRYENWPIAGSYIRRLVGEEWEPAFHGVPRNFEEASLAMMPRLIYEKFVKGYTEKQWGVPASSLSGELARRFDVRENDDPRLMLHTYQGIPEKGYASFVQAMLEGIPVMLNVDYLRERRLYQARKLLVFTGAIDEYYRFDLGRLAYRGQERQHEFFPDEDFVQPVGQVNNPSAEAGPHIRSLEWKHMMSPRNIRRVSGTLVTHEVTVSPADPDRYEYPFPDAVNAELYRRYRERADATPGLLVCGRLGEYRYYDMDQAIGRALMLAGRILKPGHREETPEDHREFEADG